jgi:hypothetical protein
MDWTLEGEYNAVVDALSQAVGLPHPLLKCVHQAAGWDGAFVEEDCLAFSKYVVLEANKQGQESSSVGFSIYNLDTVEIGRVVLVMWSAPRTQSIMISLALSFLVESLSPQRMNRSWREVMLNVVLFTIGCEVHVLMMAHLSCFMSGS